MLTDRDRCRLLEIARSAVVAHLGGLSAPSPEARDETLLEPAAAFVTLRAGRALRGCIGSVTATRSLFDTVVGCAVAGATEDPRFPPLDAQELAAVTFEISVLGSFEPITGPHEIETGRHGVVVERGAHRGLLLPQVAVEWEWDGETFLGQTCRKAGLELDAWRSDVRIFRFEAEVFGEEP